MGWEGEGGEGRAAQWSMNVSSKSHDGRKELEIWTITIPEEFARLSVCPRSTRRPSGQRRECLVAKGRFGSRCYGSAGELYRVVFL